MRDILDLDRFALDQPGSDAWFDLVERCRADLQRDGMFNLQGLMRADMAGGVAADLAPRFATDSFCHQRAHNVYFADVPGLAADHPALARFDTSNNTLCADQIAGSPLLRLYEWPELAGFMAATMQLPKLHVMPDPLARVNVISYGEGQALNWHFDRSQFTTTLLLQAPEQGGTFEYRTGLRSDDDPNYDGVAALLQGRDPALRRLTLTPGTLSVFRGRNTAHRVTPVRGGTARMIAVFSYYERPDVMFSETERLGFFGRAS